MTTTALPRYAVVTPVRNEADRFPFTRDAMLGQTLRPTAWIVVDDGSRDGTGRLADEAASQHAWISVVHRADRGHASPGTGVMEAFEAGLARLGATPWDFLVKLDGDLSFEPDYFASCLARFAQAPRLGIGGGLVCCRAGDDWVVDSPGDPAFHVRGATKIYRRACWEQIGGLVRAPGWDTIDELKANLRGWTTRTFAELRVLQHKRTGATDGAWRNWVKNGRANYVTGYDPLFMLAKVVRRLGRPPYLVAGAGLLCGYAGACLRHCERLRDPELLDYVRREQRRALLLKPSLWTSS